MSETLESNSLSYKTYSFWDKLCENSTIVLELNNLITNHRNLDLQRVIFACNSEIAAKMCQPPFLLSREQTGAINITHNALRTDVMYSFCACASKGLVTHVNKAWILSFVVWRKSHAEFFALYLFRIIYSVNVSIRRRSDSTFLIVQNVLVLKIVIWCRIFDQRSKCKNLSGGRYSAFWMKSFWLRSE